jgi:hypothetical protein
VPCLCWYVPGGVPLPTFEDFLRASGRLTAMLFDKALAEIEQHFDIRRVFRITDAPRGTSAG